MADKRMLELVLREQKEEAIYKLSQHYCERSEESLVNLHSDLAQVIMGVRRSGKSTLCFNVLKRNDVNFGYVNFDDERLLNCGSEDLNDILEILYKINGKFNILFLDEAQNVEGWHLFVNRLLRRGVRLLITGSNAKLLSHELATHLTGRYEAIELFPFSFKEFCDYLKIERNELSTWYESQKMSAFDNYISQGGFPELLKKHNPRKYISNLLDSILLRDIRQRHRLRYFSTFERLANHLLNIVPVAPSSDKLLDVLGVKSTQTIRNYIEYLIQAYVILRLPKFSFKSRQRLTEEKLYPVDVAFMDNRENALAPENIGWRLETIVFLELKRRAQLWDFDLYYYKKHSRAKEVDFVVCKGREIKSLYQVAYDISNAKTKNREVASLIDLSNTTGCKNLFLITDYERGEFVENECTIKIIPAYEWLLNDMNPSE